MSVRVRQKERPEETRDVLWTEGLGPTMGGCSRTPSLFDRLPLLLISKQKQPSASRPATLLSIQCFKRVESRAMKQHAHIDPDSMLQSSCISSNSCLTTVLALMIPDLCMLKCTRSRTNVERISKLRLSVLIKIVTTWGGSGSIEIISTCRRTRTTRSPVCLCVLAL